MKQIEQISNMITCSDSEKILNNFYDILKNYPTRKLSILVATNEPFFASAIA